MPICSLSDYSYHQFHLSCSDLMQVVMHKTLWHRLSLAEESEIETSLWTKTKKKDPKAEKS